MTVAGLVTAARLEVATPGGATLPWAELVVRETTTTRYARGDRGLTSPFHAIRQRSGASSPSPRTENRAPEVSEATPTANQRT